ncbi:MAG: OmpA family protein [Bacteroidia bacterium]|nr:OmpA family protein [Bacteroidia bacterium]
MRKHSLQYKIIGRLLFIAFILISVQAFPQNIRKQRADKFYESGEYSKAATLYRRALKRMKAKPEKAETNFRIADCYRRINNFKKIESFYKRAIQLNYPDPIIYLNYADVLKMLEKYDDAIVQYQNYGKYVPNDRRADEGIESTKLVREWKKTPTLHVVKIFKKINSKYDDFCPSYDEAKDYSDIYFTSNRDKNSSKTKRNSNNSITVPQKSNITGQIFCDIFQIKKNRKEEWTDPVALDTIVNTVFDDGATTITKDGKTMYYTICKMEKNKQIGCQIYESKKTAGAWGVPKFLKLVKDTTLSIGHPSVSADGAVIYFASAMKGGKGGKDIWKIEKDKKGDWTAPANVKEINTEYDEDFPCIREDGILFFSSNRFPTMGGLDIFKAEKNEDGKIAVENMKYPLNSSGDDFGIVFQGKSEKGHFTSNRPGGQGGDDIYTFEVPPVEFTVKGLVKNESNHVIPGAIVKLFGSDGSQFKDTTGKEGVFQRKLKKKTDYVFAVYKEGYFMGKGKFSTAGLVKTTELTPEVVLTTLAKTFEIPNINYDFGSWTLKPEAMLALDSLVDILKDNPNLTIELSSHTDMVGNDEINNEISQKRAQSVVDYVEERGINPDRMVAVGYGKTHPKAVTKELAAKFDFLHEGDILNDAFVNKLPKEERDIANTYNRRTEFKVLSANFVPNKK